MIKPFTPAQATTITYEKKAIGGEAVIYRGSSTTDPSDPFDGQYYVKTAATYGIYLYTNQAWVRQTTPTNDMIARSAYDVMIAVKAGTGTLADYIGSGVNFSTALIEYLFALYIKVLSGGSLRGGDRYGEGGTVVSALVDGWWLGAGTDAGFKARAKGLDLTFCNTAGTVVGHIGPDNLLFDTDDYNTSVGYLCIPESASGNYNEAFGYSCLQNLSDGTSNVAMGYKCLQTNTTGNYNVAIGLETMMTVASAESNVAIGHQAMRDASGASVLQNVAVGPGALHHNKNGFNVAVGSLALYSNTDGDRNIGIGVRALYANTTGIYNTAVGDLALSSNVTGNLNTAFGYNALKVYTAGDSVAVGAYALANATSGSNIAVGARAGESLLSGYSNAIVGNNAMGGASAATCTFSVAVGEEALNKVTSGNDNVAVGALALQNCTTGGLNTAVGRNALITTTTQNRSTAVGWDALYNSTADNNSALGGYAGDDATTETNITCIGYDSQITGSNQVQLGNAGTTTYAYGAVQNRSDKRDKADIKPVQLGLQFINKLTPVDFKWDYREDYKERVEHKDSEGKVTYEIIQHEKDGSKKRSRYHHGLIAQDVKKVMDELGVDFGGYQDHKLNGGQDVLSLGYEEFIAPMIKAIQEQQVMIETLQNRLALLEAK